MLIKPNRYFAKDGGNGGAATPSADESDKKEPASTTGNDPEPTTDIPEWFTAIQDDPAAVWQRIQDLRAENKTWRQKFSAAKEAADNRPEREPEPDATTATPDPTPDPTIGTPDLDRLRQENQRLTEARNLDALKLKVGAELGLNATLIQRLQGATEDELRQDGETLLKLVTPEDSGSGRRRTTQTPGGSPAGETDDDRRARLFGGSRGRRVFTSKE